MESKTNTNVNIIKALIQFHVQAGGGVAMDAANPFFKSRYATLGQIINVINALAPALGLTWVQFPVSAEAQIGVKTMVFHESGEVLEDQVMVPFTQEILRLDSKGVPYQITRNAAQEAGSAITYLRRYGLAAAFGLYADEDLDGNTPDQVKAAPVVTGKPAFMKAPEPEEVPIDPDFPEAGSYVAPEVASTNPKVSAKPNPAAAWPSSGNSPISLKTSPAITKAEHTRKIQPVGIEHEGEQFGYALRAQMDAMNYSKAASEAQIRFLERLFVDLVPDADIRHEVRWDILRVNDFKGDPGLSHPRIAAFMKWINPTPVETGEFTAAGKPKMVYTFPQEVIDAIEMASAPYLTL